MWGRVIQEVEAALDARLGEAIGIVAAARGAELDEAFTRYEWKGLDLNIREFPAVVVRPAGVGLTAVTLNPSIREGRLPLRVGYGYLSQDRERVQRHVEHVPEALVMVLERLDELTESVLGVQGDLETRWDTVAYESEQVGSFEGWVSVDGLYRVYTDALLLG